MAKNSPQTVPSPVTVDLSRVKAEGVYKQELANIIGISTERQSGQDNYFYIRSYRAIAQLLMTPAPPPNLSDHLDSKNKVKQWEQLAEDLVMTPEFQKLLESAYWKRPPQKNEFSVKEIRIAISFRFFMELIEQCDRLSYSVVREIDWYDFLKGAYKETVRDVNQVINGEKRTAGEKDHRTGDRRPFRKDRALGGDSNPIDGMKAPDEFEPWQIASNNEQLQNVRKAESELDAREQRVLKAKICENKTWQELSDEIGPDARAVYRRAVEKLRRALSEDRSR